MLTVLQNSTRDERRAGHLLAALNLKGMCYLTFYIHYCAITAYDFRKPLFDSLHHLFEILKC